MLLLTPPLLLSGALEGLPLAPLGLLGLTPPLMYIAGQARLHDGRRAAFGLDRLPGLALNRHVG